MLEQGFSCGNREPEAGAAPVLCPNHSATLPPRAGEGPGAWDPERGVWSCRSREWGLLGLSWLRDWEGSGVEVGGLDSWALFPVLMLELTTVVAPSPGLSFLIRAALIVPGDCSVTPITVPPRARAWAADPDLPKPLCDKGVTVSHGSTDITPAWLHSPRMPGPLTRQRGHLPGERD